MIALPPVLDGAVQLTCAWPVAPAAVTALGADGGVIVDGVTAPECSEAGPVPMVLVAVTVKV